MGKLFKKLNDSWIAQLQSRAKFTTIVYPVIGSLFALMGMIILVMGILDRSYISGVAGFAFCAIIAALFFLAVRVNRNFLKNTGASRKTQAELFRNALKKTGDVFKKK